MSNVLARGMILIGMSNVGKSHWSKMLENQMGYRRFDCDRMIEQLIDKELPPNSELTPTKRLSRWMGFPLDVGYRERRDRYLQLENEVMMRIVSMIRQDDSGQPFVVDTTGSFVHLPEETRKEIASLGIPIVALESTQGNIDHVIENFERDPYKPIAYPDAIITPPLSREDDHARLLRYYSALISFREPLYEASATCIVHPEQLRELKDMGPSREAAEGFLKQVELSISSQKPEGNQSGSKERM